MIRFLDSLSTLGRRRWFWVACLLPYFALCLGAVGGHQHESGQDCRPAGNSVCLVAADYHAGVELHDSRHCALCLWQQVTPNQPVPLPEPGVPLALPATMRAEAEPARSAVCYCRVVARGPPAPGL